MVDNSAIAANQVLGVGSVLLSANNLSDVANATTSLANLGGLKATNNLSDLNNLTTALSNLGGLKASNNLSDVSNPSTAISNLGALKASNNLSDVGSASTALSNLGGAPLISPALTGTPTAPTPASSDNSTTIATTAFVQSVAVGGLGAWQIKSFNTVYLATTDGFIMASTDGTQLEFQSNSSNPPTTVRSSTGVSGASVSVSVTGIVRSGDYWKMNQAGGSADGPYFISLGV